MAAAILALLGRSTHVHAQTFTATITYPLNGAVNADLSQPIQWTSVSNVQAYYLYVGTTPGNNDLVNTGEIQQTSYLASNLPSARLLYARMWAKVAGIWRYTDSTFTAALALTSLTAVITYPANGALEADLSQAIRWTSVDNVQAYYLYVGSTPGAKDLVNTGEIQQTSYLASNLPTGQMLYARMWTKVAGVWRYTDSTFSTAPRLTAVITYPANGAINADVSLPVQWTAVANVQAYYLYVGTTPGAKNLVDTGEIQQTSYLAASLPAGQTLYARMWTKAAGVWRYTDSAFSAAPAVTARITHPANGAVNADMSQPIQWTSVAGVQAYYLYLGTTPGAKDLVNTGETQQTSYLASNLPIGQTLYARMWTKVGGVWRYADSTFSAGTSGATVSTITYPADGGQADPTQPIRWTTVPNVQAYYLYVGTTPGAKDLVNTGEIQQTSFLALNLPASQTLYARVWVKINGLWRYSDSTFSVAPSPDLLRAVFTYPLDGEIAVDRTRPATWTSVPNAQVYYLYVGTTIGAKDLVNSGEIQSTSFSIAGLPSDATLYARLWTKTAGVWRHTDIAFTADASTPIATIETPAHGESGFDTARPFAWQPVAIARGYRLTIGSTRGAKDLHDSGEIQVSRRFVPGLPVGTPLYGRLETKIDGQWLGSDFSFTVVANTLAPEQQIEAAKAATGLVRDMAGVDNTALGWTQLARTITPRLTANCVDYATALLQVLAQMNLQLPARRLDVALSPYRDEHTLVEIFRVDVQRWMVLDPTFGLLVTRTADGDWATAEDISDATRISRWSDVSYLAFGSLRDEYARSYYLDYPLLFVNVYHEGQNRTSGQGGPVLPYMLERLLPISDTRQVYVVGCSATTTTTTLNVDGVNRTIDCSGVDGLSAAFYASTITTVAQTAASTKTYVPRRFVF
jgi:hypothetical protein